MAVTESAREVVKSVIVKEALQSLRSDEQTDFINTEASVYISS